MLAMLMLNAILGDVTDDVMLRHFRSQTILAANSTSAAELEREYGRASSELTLTLTLTPTLTLTQP